MKKHLVIICGVMYPTPSATGICAQRFAELLVDEYDIDIICIASDMEAVTLDGPSGIGIHALAGGTMRLEAHSNSVMRKLTHLWGQVQIKTRFLGNMQWYSAAAVEKLKEIDNAKKIDVIFSVCSPISAHYAALEFQKIRSSVRWVAYTVDLYSTLERIRPLGYTLDDLADREQSILQKADAVLLSEEISNSHPKWGEILNNVERLPYVIPEIKAIPLETTEAALLKKDKINCVFAGSFYQDIRSPRAMLDLFSKLDGSFIKLHLFSSGCEETVEKYALEYKSIIVHGRIPYEQIQRIYQEADVLINVGNANENFIPSKTFEYIATGKPIINFYYGEEPDKILCRYPLAFHIPNEGKGYEVPNVVKFIKNSKGKEISRDRIENLYPENTIEHIKSLLCEKIG